MAGKGIDPKTPNTVQKNIVIIKPSFVLKSPSLPLAKKLIKKPIKKVIKPVYINTYTYSFSSKKYAKKPGIIWAKLKNIKRDPSILEV